MMRASWALMVGLTLLVPGQCLAAEKAPEGSWKLSMPTQGGFTPVWIIKITAKDGQYTADLVAAANERLKGTLNKPTLEKDLLRFTMTLPGGTLRFEFKVGTEQNLLRGSYEEGGDVTPAHMERTTMTSLDPLELAKETIATSNNAMEIWQAVLRLTSRAGFLKSKPEDVRAWVDKAMKLADSYSPAWQRELLTRLVRTLNRQDGMAAVTLPYARRLERMMSPNDLPDVQEQILEQLATALERAGKNDEAKEVQARIKKIDQGIRIVKYPGRASKSKRVVLVELFTGSECPPCVAADMAFDALSKSYKPSEVVLLQYHQHIPRPDPLTNPDGEKRMEYYAKAFEDEIGGTPSILFNGTPAAGGGGGPKQAQAKYTQYREVINPLLEKPEKATVNASATRKGDKITIKAEVSDLKEIGASIKLRLVLLEEEVEFKGGNGLTKHHCVVRAFPGGLEGMELKDKKASKEVTVDLEELRKNLNKYLDDRKFDKDKETRPMEFKKLRVVALVQDDNTREVLQAIQVNVEDAK